MNQEVSSRIAKMLSIPLKNGEDVSIGSFYYDVAAMYALEEVYIKDFGINISKNIFINSCDEETLLTMGSQMGMIKIEEDYARGSVILSSTEEILLPQGTEISGSTTENIYLTDEVKTIGNLPTEVKIICNKPGKKGNLEANKLDTCGVSGITILQEKIIVGGTDNESLEEYRYRLSDELKSPKRNGNKKHIEAMAEEYIGIGRARCIPSTEGNALLRVLALNEELELISESKRQELKLFLSDKISDFANLQVEIPQRSSIDISLTCRLNPNYTVENLKKELRDIVTVYFKEVSLNTKDNIVSIMDLITIINPLESLSHLNSLKLNSTNTDISLTESQVPILNLINVEVI